MSNAKSKATRFLSLVMVFAMMLGLIPVLQQNADAVYTDDNSFRLTLTPIYGKTYEIKDGNVVYMPKGNGDANSWRYGTANDASFAGTIYYGDTQNIIYEDSCTAAAADATITKDSMYVAKDVTIYMAWSVQEKAAGDPKLNAKDLFDNNERRTGIGYTSVSGDSSLHKSVPFDKIWDTNAGSQIIYFNAQFYVNGEKKGDLTLSADMTHAKKATSTTTRYKGVGFQIMGVDEHALGPYDYIKAAGDPNAKESNRNQPFRIGGGDGLWVNEKEFPKGTQTFKAYPNIKGKETKDYLRDTEITTNELYHIMSTQNVENGGVYSAVSFSQEELTSLFAWVNDVYLQAPELKGNVTEQVIKGNTMTLHGPRIICCYYGAEGYTKDNDSSTKYYNLQWYNPKGTEKTNPNSHTTWPESIKDGFAEWRYVKFVVPTSNAASVTVNCYDLSKLKSGASKADALIGQTITLRSSDKFTNNEQLGKMIANIFGAGNTVEEQAKYETKGTPEYFISLLRIEAMDTIWGTSFFTNGSDTVGKIVETDAASYNLLGKGTTEWFPVEKGVKKDTAPTQVEKYYQQIHDLYASWITGSINDMINSIKHDAVMKDSSLNTIEESRRMYSHIDVTIPTASYLKTLDKNIKADYVFDHGILNDAANMYTEKGYNCTPIMPGTSKITVLGTTGTRTPNLDLYYMPDGDGQYTVKVKIDGEEQPDLERKYTNIPIGTVINEPDVTIPPLPDEAKVKDIENVPLTVDNTPEDNIIIINAGEDTMATLTIYYYLDGVLKDEATKTMDVLVGTEFLNAPTPGTQAFINANAIIDYEVGTPLTVKPGENVIRAYYKSNTPPTTAVRGNLKLFTDKAYTKPVPSKYASGYGFFAKFYVDVPAWLGHAVRYNERTNTPKSYNYHVLIRCGVSRRTATSNLYKDIDWSAKATWTDGMGSGKKIVENGRAVRDVNLTLSSESTDTKLVFILPINAYSAETGDAARKAYIPVGTKDGNVWGITCTFTCDYKMNIPHIDFRSGRNCNGHLVKRGKRWVRKYCGPFDYDYQENYVQQATIVKTATAKVTISGSMYEDDFTSDKR